MNRLLPAAMWQCTHEVTSLAEQSRQRRELLHAYGKAVTDHTAAGNSLRAYLNGNAIRPAKGDLELESTRQWMLKQRD